MKTPIAYLILVTVSLSVLTLNAQIVTGFTIEDEKQAEITGLSVSKYHYTGDERYGNTSVSLTVRRNSSDIITLKADNSELKSLTDDKGLNLVTETIEKGRGTAVMRHMLGMSKDGKSAGFKFTVTSIPSVGAESLEARGEIALVAGTEKTTAKSDVFAFEAAQKVRAGDIVLELEKAEKSEDGKSTLVTFSFSGLPRQIIEVDFFSSRGKMIGKTRSEHSIIGVQPDGNATCRLSYELKGDVTEAAAKITYWKTWHDVTVRFNTSTNLGLSSK